MGEEEGGGWGGKEMMEGRKRGGGRTWKKQIISFSLERQCNNVKNPK